MKFLIIFVVMVALCAAERSDEDKQHFKDWCKKHNKEYKDSKEESAAMEIVLNHKKIIDDHNKLHDSGKKTFRMKLNKFSDLSDEEFIKHYTGYDPKTDNDSSRPSRAAKKYYFPEAPKSADFRNQTGPVFDQKHCGSCWAFSTAQIATSVISRSGGNSVVSPQQILNCDTVHNNGCDGGNPNNGLLYIKSHGIGSNEDHPYQNIVGKCDKTDRDNIVNIKKVERISTNGDEALMKKVIGSKGPVAIAMTVVDSLRHYHHGIYRSKACNKKDPNHAPVIVGYGTSKDGDYWIMKNSWGPDWGDLGGYAHIARNEHNMCNVAHFNVYAE